MGSLPIFILFYFYLFAMSQFDWPITIKNKKNLNYGGSPKKKVLIGNVEFPPTLALL
jgi:hypothetical protein